MKQKSTPKLINLLDTYPRDKILDDLHEEDLNPKIRDKREYKIPLKFVNLLGVYPRDKILRNSKLEYSNPEFIKEDKLLYILRSRESSLFESYQIILPKEGYKR